MRKILVVGGAGFIGSHLCEHLIKEDEQNIVCAMDSLVTGDVCNVEHLYNDKRFEFVDGYAHWDYKNFRSFALNGILADHVDDIYYLASIASPKRYLANPFGTISANIDGLINALQLANQFRARILYTSTSEIYGDPETSPQKESYNGNVDPNSERAVYDESKRMGETLVSVWRRNKGVDTRTIRIFNTYGPRMGHADGRVVPTFMKQVIDGQPITIYGDGQQTRSFCYVKDTVRAARLVMESGHHEPFNVGNPEAYVNMIDLASAIKSLVPTSNSQVVFLPLPTPNDPRVRRPDIDHIKQVTGWQPEIPLYSGLLETLQWMQTT